MRRTGAGVAVLAAAAVLGAGQVEAQEGAPGSAPEEGFGVHAVGFGARIGGYGFRDAGGGAPSWFDCRMDGAGLFGTVDLSRHLFGELSLDFYQATGDTVQTGMDRLSLHSQAALGLRMVPDFWVVPSIQVGGGAEWTEMELLGTGETWSGWRPSAFFGIGAELNVLEQVRFGADLRILAMAHPDHEHAGDEGAGHVHQALGAEGAEGAEALGVEFGAAGQALFFVRYIM